MILHDYPDTEGVLNDQQKKHLLQWLHEGTGVVALNSSFKSFYIWENINESLGAKTVGNSQSPTNIKIIIQDSSHPILDDIPSTIQMVSQFYSLKEFLRIARSSPPTVTKELPMPCPPFGLVDLDKGEFSPSC